MQLFVPQLFRTNFYHRIPKTIPLRIGVRATGEEAAASFRHF